MMTLRKALIVFFTIVLVAMFYWYLLKPTKSTAGDLKGLKYVTSDVNWTKYLGTWFELKRIDNWFQADLTKVTANYSLMSNGKVRVVNTGHNKKSGDISIAVAEARFCSDVGSVLIVSFFPFVEAPYVLLHLNEDSEKYSLAIVGSVDRKFLWLLSRNTTASQQDLDLLTQVALDNGYSQDVINTMV